MTRLLPHLPYTAVTYTPWRRRALYHLWQPINCQYYWEVRNIKNKTLSSICAFVHFLIKCCGALHSPLPWGMSAYKSKKLFNLFRHVAVNATLAGVLPLSSRRCCCTCTCHSGAYCYFTCLLLSLTIYYFLCALRCQHINIKFSSCCRALLGDFWLLARCQLVKCAYFTTLWHVL